VIRGFETSSNLFLIYPIELPANSQSEINDRCPLKTPFLKAILKDPRPRACSSRREAPLVKRGICSAERSSRSQAGPKAERSYRLAFGEQAAPQGRRLLLKRSAPHATRLVADEPPAPQTTG
jgi:hypothetical protein